MNFYCSCRMKTITFLPGQTKVQTSLTILNDQEAENTEVLVAELANPRGGAEIGSNRAVTISILSNDDGHGIIEFAEVMIATTLEHYI